MTAPHHATRLAGRALSALSCALIALLLTALPAVGAQETDDPPPPADQPAPEAPVDPPPAEGDGDPGEGTGEGDGDPGEGTGEGEGEGEGEEPEFVEPPAPPPASLFGVAPAPTAAIDEDLQAALTTVGFLDTWFALTPTDPTLSLVEVTGPAADLAAAELAGGFDELIANRELTSSLVKAARDAAARGVVLDLEADDLRLERKDLVDDRTELRDEMNRILLDIADVERATRGTMVELYVRDSAGPIDSADVPGYNAHEGREVAVGATLEELADSFEALEQERSDTEQALEDLAVVITELETAQAGVATQRAAIDTSIDLLTTEIGQLTERRVELEADLPQVIARVHEARMLGIVPAVDLPLVTLDSYVRAEAEVAQYRPGCALRWPLLAGIATVESGHGTFGGATVGSDGQIDDRILGPLLDGSLEGTAVITDTDGGVMDGNAEFDAAVGPFQFIPGTWKGYGLDATGDGLADPHNMYDGALSAAGYLCASSDVSSDGGVERSVLSYNNSRKYLSDVTRFARGYMQQLSLPEAPYDPELLDPADGWTLAFGGPDEDTTKTPADITADLPTDWSFGIDLGS